CHLPMVMGKDGKNKAVNARIEGVTPIKQSLRTQPQPNNQFFSFLIWIAIISILALGYTGVTIYKTLTKEPELKNTDLSPNVDPIIISTPKKKKYSKYSCDGKVHCSEMSSCEEARFYIKNCSGTKIDGDNDGKPCEDRCGH
ncbi:MAG: excalibur calcium-binding domain-containing protein, partial [Candidatus Marithrix sp.]